MSKYLMSRKNIELAVLEWEKLYAKGATRQSMPMFIRDKQALYMAEQLFLEGIHSEKLEQLKKELENPK